MVLLHMPYILYYTKGASHRWTTSILLYITYIYLHGAHITNRRLPSYAWNFESGKDPEARVHYNNLHRVCWYLPINHVYIIIIFTNQSNLPIFTRIDFICTSHVKSTRGTEWAGPVSSYSFPLKVIFRYNWVLFFYLVCRRLMAVIMSVMITVVLSVRVWLIGCSC